MKRVLRILGLSAGVTTILVISVASAVIAAGPAGSGIQAENQTRTRTQTQLQTRTPGTCGQCTQDCVPNNYDYNYATQGPNGFQKGK